MKHLVILLVTLLSVSAISATWASAGEKSLHTVTADSLRTADLLFVLNSKGNAITEVTEGVDHLPIDHVGIVFRTSSGLFVMEATSAQGVTLTPLSTFIERNCQPDLISSVVVGRTRRKVDLKRLMEKWESYRGLPYDSLYLPDDREMYCSELVQKMLYDDTGKPIYSTIPMSFHDNHGKITRYWRKFYHQRGLKVPDGKSGTNPGQLSRDANTAILGMLITSIKISQNSERKI